MRTIDLRSRLLWAIGVSGLAASPLAACGSSTDSTHTTTPDAGQDGAEAASDAAADALSDSPVVDDADEGGDSGTDAMPDGPPLTVRRPFLVGSSLRAAEPTRRNDWTRGRATSAGGLDAPTARALRKVWEDDALQEHASIAAFARFTMHLLSVGAPPDLIAGAQRAGLDEVRHARACFSLAARYGGESMGPAPLVVSDSLEPLSLPDLAALTAEEGCVGETLGVVLAREQLAHATCPFVVAELRRIALDEERHAELAWRFVRWAIVEGGEPVRAAVVAAIERAVARTREIPVRTYAVDLSAWHAHGRLTCAEARAVSEQGIRDIVQPCAAALSSILTGAFPPALNPSINTTAPHGAPPLSS